jgi:hypothetical protein
MRVKTVKLSLIDLPTIGKQGFRLEVGPVCGKVRALSKRGFL